MNDGIQTLIHIKRKKWFFCYVFLTIPFFISGCSSSDSGKQLAYEIRDQLNADINVDATKAASLQNQPSANSDGTQKKAVNAKGANIVNARETINIYGFSLQVEDFQFGNTIYDVCNIMSKDKADEYCKWVLNGGTNWPLLPDGTFKSGTDKSNDQLAFIKCRIKNNNDSATRLDMGPDFYGVKDGKWGYVTMAAYAFSGKHVPYYNPKTGITSKTTYTFEPGEELETVFMVMMSKEESNGDIITYRYFDENVDIYMASGFLNENEVGVGHSSDLPPGTYLIPIIKNGKAVN